jgi:uncharacterized protein YacL
MAGSRPRRWPTPVLGLAIGIAYLAAGWVAGNLTFGLVGFALMAAASVLLLIASRHSETVRGLLDRRDERISGMDARATVVTANVLIVAIIVAFVVEIAHGQDGMPYAWLGAIGGVTYVLTLIVLRLRG